MKTFYELISLLPGTLSDEEAQAITASILQCCEKAGAAVIKHGIWEKRKLAYPITGIRQGTYIVTEFDLESNALPALERTLQLDKAILRHQIIRAHKKTAREIEQEARRKVEEDRPHAAESRKAMAMPAGEPISSEKLEEKLEEILSDDMTK